MTNQGGTINGNDHVIDAEKQAATLPLITTQARDFITPYLPPPLVVAIHEVDKRLESYVGQEATINLLATVLAGMMVVYFLQFFINGRQRSPRRAWADEREEEGGPNAWRATVDYGSTIILCGPSGGGKTTLFYQLCPGALPKGQSLSRLSTLSSMRPNLALTTINTTIASRPSDDKQNPPLRVIDYSGHMSLQDELFVNWLFPKSSPAPTRLILVVDATQKINSAAQALYQLLELASTRQSSRSSRLEIMIACHKADAPQAKNWRRIKLQMRTELDRRFSHKSGMDDMENVVDTREAPSWWPKLTDNKSTTWDLEQLPVAQISFCSSSCQQSLAELVAFCEGGHASVSAPDAN